MTMNWLGKFLAIVAIFGMPSLEAYPTTTEASSLDRCTAGQQYHSNPNYCTKYFQCVHGEPIERDCAQGTVFSEMFSVCVHPGSEFDTCTPEHPDRECARNTTDFIPHPTRCQGYYNCSDYVPYILGNRVWSRGYEKECPYPKLFDIRLKRCEDYQNIVCGSKRVEAKWRCDYYAEQCPVAMCRPCWVDNPSCVGKANGLWPVPYAIWSPYYIECKDERDFKGRLSCPEKELFDPEGRTCRHTEVMAPLIGEGV